MTIKDIARESGYAVGTVSRVLNNHPDVSEKARERILAVVAKNGYTQNANAKNLKQSVNRSLLVLVKGVRNELFAALVEQLRQELRQQLGAAETRRGETVAYYTAWVHQIKTPIAAMRLTLQGEDTPAARRLTAELGRIEQYVDMVLTYLRLEEGGSDYVIRPCSVDEVVRAAVRRFAGEFIDRRIRLDYEPVQWETVTDGKWLTFVVEQLLSNAPKYTGQEGAIRIYRQGDELCIADTGMGIAPEDLPRVFQMGYTGQNGRLDRRSSGIGLYLCRRICGNLRHGIRMESVPGKGTTVYLTLGRGDFLPE